MVALAAALALCAASASYRSSLALEPAPFPGPDIPAILLHVNPVQKSQANSCGEAAITMAYNYAYPAQPVSELKVIRYGIAHSLYTPHRVPFTSPASMSAIALHFADSVDEGKASSEQDALATIEDQLDAGRPVVIDVTTVLSDNSSGAHFVLVIGYATDLQSGMTLITFNNPLTGQQQAANWPTIWSAWQNNGDPGGRGWWLVIPAGS